MEPVNRDVDGKSQFGRIVHLRHDDGAKVEGQLVITERENGLPEGGVGARKRT